MFAAEGNRTGEQSETAGDDGTRPCGHPQRSGNAKVLLALKREFMPEVNHALALERADAAEADLPLDEFAWVAEALNERKVIGRFSTFLEHVKPASEGRRPRHSLQRAFPLGRAERIASWKRAARSAGITF